MADNRKKSLQREEAEAEILSLIREKMACQTAEVAAHFGISVYQARYYLTGLESRGRITRSPPRRGAKTLWMKIDDDLICCLE
ncbi:FaeA/PapI family transcriptional regulator [Escherichia coli O8:H49]